VREPGEISPVVFGAVVGVFDRKDQLGRPSPAAVVHDLPCASSQQKNSSFPAEVCAGQPFQRCLREFVELRKFERGLTIASVTRFLCRTRSVSPRWQTSTQRGWSVPGRDRRPSFCSWCPQILFLETEILGFFLHCVRSMSFLHPLGCSSVWRTALELLSHAICTK
jgi:hypothetical protein